MRWLRWLWLFYGLIGGGYGVWSQQTPYRLPHVYAIRNARIVPIAGKVLEKGTVVIRDGVIVAVGEAEKVKIPEDATVLEGEKLTVYPGLIDACSTLGLPAAGDPVYAAYDRGNTHPNARVRPERRVAALFQLDPQAFSAHRRLGFTVALIAPTVGILSGQSALISLRDGTLPELLIRPVVGSHLNLRDRSPRPTGEASGSGYPDSLMGTIALVRQIFYEAQHQRQVWTLYERSPQSKPRPALNRAYEALEPVLKRQLPLIVHANSAQDILRAIRLAEEFKLKMIIAGGAEAAKVADALKKADIPLLLSLEFPESLRFYDPDSPPSLTTLRRRALAVQNVGLLHKAGVTFALGTVGLSNPTDFLRNLRTAVVNGLPKEAALEALTLVPARLFGVADRLGTIEVGKAANLTVVEGDLFDERSRVRYLFIDGHETKVETPAGLTAASAIGRGFRRFRRPPEEENENERTRLKSCCLQESANSQTQAWMRGNAESARSGAPEEPEPGTPPPPAGEEQAGGERRFQEPGGAEEKPKPMKPVSLEPIMPTPADQNDNWLIRNATVWTLTTQGVLENADVLIVNGKIKAVGKGLQAPKGTRIIEATSKHLTPGLIDCHSHIAIAGGVNESTNVCTAEVRIQDVIDAEDVDIYRQLAGGVTAANLLHGSANVIGGQNAVIKFRWGKRPEELLFKEAPPGIKFALGENVKQSNFREFVSGRQPRYPASRMGVEQVIRERFLAALEYKRQQEEYKTGKRPYPPVPDLQLEALLEVLEGKRIIHCHSYRQDEILMLIRLCEEFGVRVGTFQHALEGYKVADEIARHGAGASTFSDWWAFKVEAYDAIPFNGALMTRRGVTVSFNSDSAELARRLNLEAAKAVKYGGLSEEEALKLVTLHPAIQLGVDQYVGTIEAGKHADLALWSGHPLSVYSFCEKTFVDGILYFDRERDLEWRKKLEKEKAEYLADLRRSSFFETGRRGEGGAGEQMPEERSAPERGEGVTGVWKGRVTGAEPLPPEGLAFTLTLRLEQGNAISGTIETTMGAVNLQNGTFNPATSELNFSIEVPGGILASVTARVSGDHLSGMVSAFGQNFDLRADRVMGGSPKTEGGANEAEEVAESKTSEGGREVGREVAHEAGGEVGSGVSKITLLTPDYSASRERPLTTKGVYAIVNATIHPITAPSIQNGTVVIRDGKIEAVGEKVPVPEGAQMIDATGLHLYPGLIDPDTNLGLTEIGSVTATNDTFETGRFNPNVRVEIAVNPDSELIPVARANGITTVVTTPEGGTLAGMGCVLNLAGWTWEDLCLKSPIGLYLNLPAPSSDPNKPGEQRRREWEDSLKPLQEFLQDARRYQRARLASGKNGLPIHERDVRFEAMLPVLEGKLPLFVRMNSAIGIRAVLEWAEKESVRIVIVGGSEAWKVAPLLKAKGVPVILGRVHSLPAQEDTPYDEPFSIAKRLYEAGVTFCFSTNDTSNVRNLPYQAATAVAFGLPPGEALKALTIYPARILGLDHRLGSIELGKDANLILTTGDPLDIRTQVKQVFIAGRPVEMDTKHTRLYEKYRLKPKPN